MQQNIQSYPNNGAIVIFKNNPVKQYAWGSQSTQCFVARFSEEKALLKNYAELWIGAHPNGESHVLVDNGDGSTSKMLFSDFIRERKYAMAYMLKVLSIQKCLSLQLHPNKTQAELHHQTDPWHYPDSNDKPEMFYTLSEFECFIGYVSMDEFSRIIGLPIFQKYLSKSQVDSPRQAIIQIFKLDADAQRELVELCLDSLMEIHPSRYYQQGKETRKIWRILQDFPMDIGIVVSFFLDYRVLDSGRSFFIECNVPHAYISGECLQIVKNSDNVIRLGLTPKFKDLRSLDEVLSRKIDKIQEILPQLNSCSQNMEVQQFKAEAFTLSFYKTTSNPTLTKISPSNAVRVCLVLRGNFNCIHKNKAQPLHEGTSVCLEPGIEYEFGHSGGSAGVLCLAWAQ